MAGKMVAIESEVEEEVEDADEPDIRCPGLGDVGCGLDILLAASIMPLMPILRCLSFSSLAIICWRRLREKKSQLILHKYMMTSMTDSKDIPRKRPMLPPSDDHISLIEVLWTCKVEFLRQGWDLFYKEVTGCKENNLFVFGVGNVSIVYNDANKLFIQICLP